MKNILVTGANRIDGIGFQIASKLIQRGHQVIVTVRPTSSIAEAAVKLGPAAKFLQLDLLSPDSIRDLPKSVKGITPVLDVLINNAGILSDMEESILDVSAIKFRESFAVNCIAPAMLCQALLPLLKKSKEPRIVNISSSAGQLSDGELANWAPAYSASKAALNAITQQLAAALPQFSVNSVCPGWCSTHMGGASAPRSSEEGADTPVWLATEAPQTLTGKFLSDREEIPW